MPILRNFDAAQFKPGAPIDNPYFPRTPGSILTYRGQAVDVETGETTLEADDLFTTFATRPIAGVTTTVVRDTAYEDDRLVEDTLDG